MPIRSSINPIQPGAYSALDSTALDATGVLAGQPIPCIVAAAEGGEPNKPLYFRGTGQMKAQLRGGVAYDMARFALSAGVSQVCVIRVGAPTKGSVALAGATGTPITLRSKDWGTWVNSIQVVVGASNAVTVRFTDANGTLYQESYTGLASIAAIVAAINGEDPRFPASQFVTAEATTGALPLTTGTFSVSGGSAGSAPTAGDWTTALKAAETEDISIIVPGTIDQTVHAQFKQHAIETSTPLARKERTVICGIAASASTSDAVTWGTTLAHERVQPVYPGMVDFDATGVLTQFDGFYLAAKLAGVHCALEDEATSLTHKRVPILNATRRLSTVQGGDIDLLLQAGVTPIAPAPGSGFWVVDSITGSGRPDFRDFHKIRNADAVARRMRNVLEAAFVGRKNLNGSASSIAAAAAAELRDMVAAELIRDFQRPVVSAMDARTYDVSLPVVLVDATKFVLITVALQPSSTINPLGGTTSQDV